MSAAAYDVVVVGGGIHGVGVAQAAAAGGYSVLLLEKTALAAGTSRRSSKLIHGGLRYLESYEFGLVFESLNERAYLLRKAPDLVRLQRFYVPIYRQTRRRPWLLTLGLSLYAVLGRLRPEARFSRVPRAGWGDLDGLRTDDLEAVFTYHDGQTDDALLTRAVMNSAMGLGAELAEPAELVAAHVDAGADGHGVHVEYRNGEVEQSCRARVLVNAAGAWANRVLKRISPSPRRHLVQLVKGTHVLLEGTVTRGIYYVESPRDGRAVFVMPWNGATLVGTTETRFRGHPDAVRPRRNEKTYLARIVDHYFPRFGATERGAVRDAWAGVRVLPAGDGHAFHRSRETIFAPYPEAPSSPPRVLTLYGGKLTGYRATAAKVMRRIAPSLPRRSARADTRRLPLERP